MIGYLNGKIIDKSEVGVVLQTGGVGYDVSLPPTALQKVHVGDETSFWIYTQVREDILALYGFESKDELSFFKQLLSVSGIGPKAAMAIVSSAPIDKLKQSIAHGDPTLLSAVSGVGRKTAEKAVIELKNKLGLIATDGGAMFGGDETEEVLNALTGLGFQKSEAITAISNLPEDVVGTDAKLKASLKMLGKRK
jgi:holliday junction DNA helicase RuvA